MFWTGLDAPAQALLLLTSWGQVCFAVPGIHAVIDRAVASNASRCRPQGAMAIFAAAEQASVAQQCLVTDSTAAASLVVIAETIGDA